MELKRYWRMLLRHRRPAIGVFLAFVAVAAIVIAMIPPVYVATSKVIISLQAPALEGGQGLNPNAQLQAVTQNGNPLQTQIEIITSEPLVAKVIAQAHLRDPKTDAPMDAGGFLRHAKVQPVKGADVIALSVSSSDPALAQRAANAWAAAYERESRASNRVEASQTVRFIADQLHKTRAELQRAEAQLRDYKQANRMVDLPETARASVQTLTAIDAEMRQASAAQREARARVAALRQQIGRSSSQALTASAVAQDPTIRRLREQLVEAETTPLAYGPDHPSVKQRDARVALLERKLAETSEALVGRAVARNEALDPVRQTLVRELIAAENDAQAYAQRFEALSALASRHQADIASLPNKEYQLGKLQREAAGTAQIYEMLQRRYEEAKIQAAMNVSHVRLLESAGRPAAPAMPKPLPYFAASVFVGLLLAAGTALLCEYTDETIADPEEAEAALQLPAIGVLPWLPSAEQAPQALLAAPASPVAEAYRSLRSNLRFLANAADLRTLVFTSAGPREGKSTTIANLAISFAQAGKRVLVIDADLRKPKQHAIFGLTPALGLSEVLRGRTSLAQARLATFQAGLDVLPAGATPPNPAELLESPQLQALIAEARASYDLVLFDAPPAIAVTDACVLASQLDGLVLVLKANHVSYRAAMHALKLLKAARANIQGVVVRGVRTQDDPYYAQYFGYAADDQAAS